MARIKAVIFDLDDTLYDCTGSLVEAARRRAARALLEAGLPCSEQEAYELQSRLAKRFGPRCNVLDMIAEMYDMEESVVDSAWEAYNIDKVEDIKPFPDVIPTLKKLRAQGYMLFLVTGGIHNRQQRKIELLGIAPWFDEIIIQDKERGVVREDCLLDLMGRYGLTPGEIVAVGDRIHSEIRVANHLRMTTAQMVHGRFKSLLPENELENPDYRIHSVSEMFEVLTAARRRKARGHARIVAIGGGTGLPLLLQGLKHHTDNLSAIVTVMDSGRSSGVLRRDLGVLPPGDARNCLVALSKSEKTLLDLFQYRFRDGNLEGMSFGNLFIAALEKMFGSFGEAVGEASRILAVEGRVIPPTTGNTHICARLADGSVVREEFNVRAPGKARIERLFLEPADVEATPEAASAINSADLVVLGPGSLYTSVIANLVVPGISTALRQSNARIAYVCNIVTQPGQTDDHNASQHVKAVTDHLGEGVLDYALVNTGTPPDKLLARYEAEGAKMVEADGELDHLPLKIVREDLIEQFDPGEPPRILWEKANLIRHHPDRVAECIIKLL